MDRVDNLTIGKKEWSWAEGNGRGIDGAGFSSADF